MMNYLPRYFRFRRDGQAGDAPDASMTKYLPKVLRYLRPYKKLAVVSVILMVTSSLFVLLVPWPFAILIDCVLKPEGERESLPGLLAPVADWLGGSSVALIALLVVGGLLITVLQHALGIIDNYVNTKLELNMALDFRTEVFRHLQRLPLAFHEGRRSGMTMYITLMDHAPANLIMAVPGLVQNVLMLVAMFIVTLWLDWKLALLSLVVVPVLYYSINYYIKRIQTRLYEARVMEGEALSIIHEALNMLRVIIAFGRERHELHRFRSQSEQAVDARVKVTVRQTLFSVAVDTTTAVGTALVLGLGAYHVLQGKLTLGQLTAILYYLAMVYKPLEAISSTVGGLQDVLITLRMTFGVLETEPSIKDAPDAVSIGQSQGHIVFENVHFAYAERAETLKDISLEARPNEIIAVVGPTGAGKTTLISLLPRFYDINAGRILLDGTDIRRLTLASLRDQISIVLQEPLLFSGTIRENIRYGRLDATDEEIVAAAVAANAHDFIMRLPEQYDTMLGERGAKISGGERQRISVARAFLKDAPILILDEPTSSIDSKTEAVILDALDRLMAGRTTFMIAHRLSTIRTADNIIVLDRGQIVECGTHEELMEKGGPYKEMRDLQDKRRARRRGRGARRHEGTVLTEEAVEADGAAGNGEEGYV
jgi:ATP-binding cassette subfamily B protein/subfamily B ATP-binding cassette protein MsbA